MELLIKSLAYLLYYYLTATEIFMTARAVLSFISIDALDRVSEYSYKVTEPVVYLVRLAFSKFTDSSFDVLDIPFLVTFYLIAILRVVISSMI